MPKEQENPPPPPAIVLQLQPLTDVTLQAGQTRSLAVGVKRENCNGPIELRLESLPVGVQARNVFIPADADSGQIELTAILQAALGTHRVRLLAVAADARTEGTFQITIRQDVLAKEITNSIGMKLVLIPAGKFMMGSPANEESRKADEERHEVEITQPFYMGVYEVTQEQYEKVMGNNPSYFNKDKGGGPTHPVDTVSWEDAREFCKKLSESEKEQAAKRRYGLPTEAQWEYACRGGAHESSPFHFGRSLSSTQAHFNGTLPYGGAPKGPYPQKTTSVGSYKPNDFGLYDMHGNVWEWCADWYDKDYYKNSPIQDPKGPENGKLRVLRGGAWIEYGLFCRTAVRSRSDPGSRSSGKGFRVVLPAAPRTP
jgi:formylglycine-generating enzyme required for sulfatase activity